MAAAVAQHKGPGAREALVVLLGWMVLDRILGRLLAAFGLPTTGYGLIAAVRIVETGIFCGYWRAQGRTGIDLGMTGPKAWAGIRAGFLAALALGGLVAAGETVSRLVLNASALKVVCGRPPPLNALPALLFAGAVAGPVFEELLFRGVLYRGLRERLGPILSVLIAALIFASAHQTFTGIQPVQAAGGLLFCVAYEVTGSLWTPLILHVAGNAALFLAPFLVDF